MLRRFPIVTLTAYLVSAVATARASAPATSRSMNDTRTFELRPVAPPTPALKYRFTFDPVECYRGNAAIHYMQAALLVSSKDISPTMDRALDALGAHDGAAFRAAADELLKQVPDSMFDTIDLAAHADSCDWQPPIRERGMMALLPHLGQMKTMANILRIRATIQMRDGKIDEALSTIRLGFKMARNGGQEPVLVSGLVSVAIASLTNEPLAELMSRPDAPNLYWALASMPRPVVEFRRSMEGERSFLFSTIPALARSRNIDDLTAQDWRDVMRQMSTLLSQTQNSDPGAAAKVMSEIEITAAAAAVLPQAKQYYAQTRHVTLEQAAAIEPMKLAGVYYYEQYQSATDDIFKLLELPYPQLGAKMSEVMEKFKQQKSATPSNLFYQLIPALNRASWSYARLERQLAALTAVEAIRSYAAAASGALPQRLEDVTDTPVPMNPMTGEAFEYQVEGDTAVLRDSKTKDYVLEYTIRVTK